MKEYKLGWRYWFFLLFFSGVLLLGINAITLLLKNDVTYYDEPMSPLFSYTLAFLISLVLMSYLITVISLVKLLLRYNGCGLTLTYKGVENTVAIINLFAFVFVIPVKLIPWEAVNYYDADEGMPYIRVNTRLVQAGFLAKIVLKILGYNFCSGFVKPKVSTEDVERYSYRFSII